MPTIKITTDRQPWAAGNPHSKGAEVEVTAEEADALVKAGFAEILSAAKSTDADAAPRRRRATAEDPAL